MSYQSSLLQEILERLRELYRHEKNVRPGKFVRAGIKNTWSAVIGTDGQCGMAMNFSSGSPSFGTPHLNEAKISSFIGNSLFDLAQGCIISKSWQERAIGIAAMSALSQPFLKPESLTARGFFVDDRSADFASLLQPDDIAAVVGYGGMISKLLNKCSELYVTDMRPREAFQTLLIDREVKWCPEEPKVHTEADNEKVLSKATIISITGSSLVNGTLEELLGYCRNARLVTMYGASVCIIPDVLFEKGVDIIQSHLLIDPTGFEVGLINEMNMERVIQTKQKMQTIRKNPVGAKK